MKNLIPHLTKYFNHNICEKRSAQKVLKINPELYFLSCSVRDKSELIPAEKLSHALIGKQLSDDKGVIYTVTEATKQWYAGYYVALTLVNDQRAIMINWQNINSISDRVLDSIEDNLIFSLVD